MRKFLLNAAMMVALLFGFASCTNEELPEAAIETGEIVFGTRATAGEEFSTNATFDTHTGIVTVYRTTTDNKCQNPVAGEEPIYIELPGNQWNSWQVLVYGVKNADGTYSWSRLTWRHGQQHSGGASF